MTDRNLAKGITWLHQALAARSPQSEETAAHLGISSAPERGAGTPAQESEDEQLTPREIAENELRQTREFNSHA